MTHAVTDGVLEDRLTGAETVIWDLSVYYDGLDDPRIVQDMESITGQVDAFNARYKGRIAQLTADEMCEALETLDALSDRRGRLGTFASLNFSTDSANAQIGALVQKITEFNAALGQKLVFFELEWNQVDDAVAEVLIAAPQLATYRHQLEAARRYKPHQLSEPEEQVLMEKSVTGSTAWTRFFTQLTGAMRFEYEGEQLTQPQILIKTKDAERDVRRKAADSVTGGLKSRMMELTYIFNVLLADKAGDDRRRQYERWISARNLSNKAADSVVDALITAVTSNYDIVAQHYALKRALLGLDELTDYDRYAPLPTKDSETFYTWDEARDIVLAAFNAFSPQMGKIAARFFEENWIHAAPMPNKRGGAFASPGVPSAHPFIFVNFLGKADDVMTLAHELGHGLHMYLGGQANGPRGLYTPLTTAEMASVFAEMIVFQDLMAKESDPEVRLSMLAGKIEDTFATVFRQIAMNRFEEGIHNARREEGELTTERFNDIWLATQRAMFGDSVTLREDYGYWWSYIPHFLSTPGYVYAYAFGELLVLALYQLYQERGAAFVPQYIAVLEAGNTDYPDRILAKVGVDLNDPAFWQKGLDAIRGLVSEEVALAREVYPEISA